MALGLMDSSSDCLNILIGLLAHKWVAAMSLGISFLIGLVILGLQHN